MKKRICSFRAYYDDDSYDDFPVAFGYTFKSVLSHLEECDMLGEVDKVVALFVDCDKTC